LSGDQPEFYVQVISFVGREPEFCVQGSRRVSELGKNACETRAAPADGGRAKLISIETGQISSVSPLIFQWSSASRQKLENNKEREQEEKRADFGYQKSA
jgi:hypothetical protein